MVTNKQASALADAVNLVRIRPNNFTAFEGLGSAYFEADRLDEALTAFQHAIALNPETALAYHKIGWIHYQNGTPQQAITAFEQAICLDPNFLDSYDGLGWLYLSKLGDFDRAIEAYKRGLAANPANPFLTACLGSTYARMGQIEKALKILEQSGREHPDQIFAPSWLSYLYLRLKRFDEAATSCQREIALKEAHSPHRVLGFIFHLQGRNREAIAELERAIELEPHDYEARAVLAKLYHESGNLPAAENEYNTGREMSLEDHEYGLACFHIVYGETEKGLELLKTACEKGQVTPGWLHIDPELIFVQDEPRFLVLVREGR